MAKQKEFRTLLDAHGIECKVGDILIAARATRFGDTTFSYLVVVGRTPGMLRCRKLIEDRTTCPPSFDVERNIQEIQGQYRMKKRHGAILQSWSLLNTGRKLCTEQEIKDAFEAVDNEKHNPTAGVALP